MDKFLIGLVLMAFCLPIFASTQSDQLTANTASAFQSCLTSTSSSSNSSSSSSNTKLTCIQAALVSGLASQIQAMFALYATFVNQESAYYQSSSQTPTSVTVNSGASTSGILNGLGVGGAVQQSTPPSAPPAAPAVQQSTPPQPAKSGGIQYY